MHCSNIDRVSNWPWREIQLKASPLLGRRCPFVSSANTSRRIGFPDRSHISSQSGHISFAILAEIKFSSWGHISSLRSDLPSHVAILIPQPSSLLQAMREGIFLLLNALKPNAWIWKKTSCWFCHVDHVASSLQSNVWKVTSLKDLASEMNKRFWASEFINGFSRLKSKSGHWASYGQAGRCLNNQITLSARTGSDFPREVSEYI